MTATAQPQALSEADFLALAKSAVPEPYRASGRVVAPGSATLAGGRAFSGGPDLAEELAKELGITLPADPANSADVEFVADTSVGTRAMVVQIRDGSVSRVLQNG